MLNCYTYFAHINIFDKYQFEIFNVPDINRIRFTQEAQLQGNIATSKQSYKYLLLDLLVFQSLFQMWHKTMELIVYQRSCQWSPNHTTRQNRPSDNSHGRLGAASHHCHLIKACQALSQTFQSYTGPWKSHLEKQIWLSILFCCGV